MELWKRRAAKTIVAVVVLILVTSVLYHYIMVSFEGESPTYLHSLQVVIETYTGTGYGSDSPWDSPVANVFVSLMDLSTFLILFIVVPYVFRPVLEEALSPEVPAETALSGHVVISGAVQQGERLVDELEARGTDYVLLEPDEERALELHGRGITVVHGDPTSAESLERAGVNRAQSVVVDTVDERAASAVLAVREVNEDVRTIVLVSDIGYEQYLRYAGADTVMTPRHLLGKRIAERIRAETRSGASDRISLGEDLCLLELSVFEDSPICGESIESIDTDLDADVRILGLWTEGEFLDELAPGTVVDEDTVLLVAGPNDALREIEGETYRGRSMDAKAIVAGYGEVGATIVEELDEFRIECTVIDRADLEGVDVIGDVTDEETLRRAGIEESTVLVLAIADDDETILATLLATELSSDLDILVRIADPANATKVRRAGADYVLSLPEISGRILALEVLREQILSYDRQMKVVRIDVDEFVGRTIAETEIGDSGRLVIAVERNGELDPDVSPHFELEEGDHLLVAGTDPMIDEIEPHVVTDE